MTTYTTIVDGVNKKKITTKPMLFFLADIISRHMAQSHRLPRGGSYVNYIIIYLKIEVESFSEKGCHEIKY